MVKPLRMSRQERNSNAIICFIALQILFAIPARALPPLEHQPNPFDEVSPRFIQAQIDQIDSNDPVERQGAIQQLKNLPGSAHPAIATALEDEDLSPQTLAVLRQVEPILRARWRKVVNAREAHAEELKIAHSAYENGGHTSKLWDRPAREAIELFVKPFLMRKPGETDQKLLSLSAAAIKAGCTDPYLVYIHTRTEHALPTTERAPLQSRYSAVTKAVMKEPYPAVLKVLVATDYFHESEWIWVDEVSEPLWSNLAEVMKIVESNERAFALAEKLYLAMGRRNRQETFERILTAYAAARPENDSGPLMLTGRYYMEQVRENGRQLRRENYARAANAFTQAWEKDPNNAPAAVQMINIIWATQYSAEELDLWLQRAIAADPDCYDAYLQRLPRWHGNHAEMLELANVGFATDNWRGLIPFILTDAHIMIGRSVDDPTAYMAREEVWIDIKHCHEEHLAMFPHSAWHRSRLAYWACQCSQWEEACRLFKEIGNEPVFSAFGSEAVYKYLRRKAERNMAATPEH